MIGTITMTAMKSVKVSYVYEQNVPKIPTTIFQSIECKCEAKGTESCNKATGQCICNDHYCGELCQDTGYKCKGKLFEYNGQ